MDAMAEDDRRSEIETRAECSGELPGEIRRGVEKTKLKEEIQNGKVSNMTREGVGTETGGLRRERNTGLTQKTWKTGCT